MHTLFTTTAALIVAALPVFADVPTSGLVQQAERHSVAFALEALQPSLFDDSQHDLFVTKINDATGITYMEVSCTPSMRHLPESERPDEICAVDGSHAIPNPLDSSKVVLRAHIRGDFNFARDNKGYASLRKNLKVEYLQVDSAPASEEKYAGVLLPSIGTLRPQEALIAHRMLVEHYVGDQSLGSNQPKFEGAYMDLLGIPHIGQMDSESCFWSGYLTFVPAVSRTHGDFTVVCGREVYPLAGELRMVEAASGADHEQEYHIELALQGDESGDPFATTEFKGLIGELDVDHSGRLTDEGVSEKTIITGTVHGIDVPNELVRSWLQISVFLSRTILLNNPQPIPPA